MMQGGGKLNLVPNEAKNGVDVRAETKEEQQRIDDYFKELEGHNKSINIFV